LSSFFELASGHVRIDLVLLGRILAPTPTPTPAPAPVPAPPPATGLRYGSMATAELGAGARLNGAIPFPSDNAWNREISTAPVDANSPLSHVGAHCIGARDRMHACRPQHVMPSTRATPRRSLEQRLLLFGFVVALVCAQVLANLWPAFGKGAMLYVGESSAHAAHAEHADHAAHEGHPAPATRSHHEAHCALCVLALLGWAPPVVADLGSADARVINRDVQVASSTPRLLLLWRTAQPRAPPLGS
jgi:Protein of unknown function (DUF2946)